MTVEPHNRLRYLFALAARYHFTQQERLDLAEIVLRRDVHSWSQLSRQDITRLIDTLEGHALVTHLLDTRPPKEQQH